MAALHMERASELSAERDHELRNGLVHLARINEGPGLPPGREHAVLEPGVRDESAGGTGLGLHISRQLVAREVGTLTLRTAESPHGCVAAVTVPAAPASSFSTHPKDWIVDRAGCG